MEDIISKKIPTQKENKEKEEISLFELNQNEKNLILKLRTEYRYGEIIIVMHDGIPQRLKKIEIFDDLHGSLDD